MRDRILLSLLAAAAAAMAQNATQAGRFFVDHPTLLNLGFEWAITGDANRNATVAVQPRLNRPRTASPAAFLTCSRAPNTSAVSA
jgi:hypothetical protein